MRFTLFLILLTMLYHCLSEPLHKPGSLQGIGGDLQHAANMEFD
jgi:hypothetical protein